MTVNELVKALCLKEKEVVSDGRLKIVGWDRIFRINTTFSGYISISNKEDSFFFFILSIMTLMEVECLFIKL